jgi:ribosomal protein S7
MICLSNFRNPEEDRNHKKNHNTYKILILKRLKNKILRKAKKNS